MQHYSDSKAPRPLAEAKNRFRYVRIYYGASGLYSGLRPR
jgi:hypothetical protein